MTRKDILDLVFEQPWRAHDRIVHGTSKERNAILDSIPRGFGTSLRARYHPLRLLSDWERGVHTPIRWSGTH